MLVGGIFLFFRLLFFIALSWALIHVLAFFGFFLSLAIPMWWLFSPNSTNCLICRIKKISSCNFSHPILSMVLVFIFTILSIGLIFTEKKFLAIIGFPPTPKTVFFSIPSKGQYRLGEIFPLKINIDGIKNPINAVQADIGFSPEKLEALEVSTKDSFANIFIQKEINNQAGFARLTGGLPNPGFFGNHGLFGTVYFKGKSSGVVKIEFLPSSMVLANDGRGTNVLKELASVSYLILPEKLTHEEEEMQKSVILGPSVLGINDSSTQINFSEGNEVLGAWTKKDIGKTDKINLLNSSLGQLQKLDDFILNHILYRFLPP